MVAVAGSGSCGGGGRATRRRRPNLGCLMCGIVAVLRRSSGRMPPDGAHLLGELEQAVTSVGELCGSDLAASRIEAFTSVQVALSALDRLEVRGRDSAGLHVFVHHHALDLDDPAIARLLDQRRDPLFGSRAVRRAGDSLSFVYKAAAEIGELGDNTASLRRAIR